MAVLKPPPTRQELLRQQYPQLPAFRLRQAETALFQDGISDWSTLTTFPAHLKQSISNLLPWMSVRPVRILQSRSGDTLKAILQTSDDLQFETVLMQNRRDQWTMCVSVQIGCAMGCTFCATGAMGLKRSLNTDEIVDQYRFWHSYLRTSEHTAQRISNVVFMGMGEPLANYENLKQSIAVWLRNTDLGPTRITVSSVGVLLNLKRLLTDPQWPPVRIAISLHSANQRRREEIVPTTTPHFLTDLADWTRQYAAQHGNRRHHLTFEYTLIEGVNDTPAQAQELAAYVRTTAATLINVIPLNPVPGIPLRRSTQNRIDAFKTVLLQSGIDVTQRRTMGQDIAAACGQLITEQSSATRNSRILLDQTPGS